MANTTEMSEPPSDKILTPGNFQGCYAKTDDIILSSNTKPQ